MADQTSNRLARAPTGTPHRRWCVERIPPSPQDDDMAPPREVPLLATADRHITLRQEFDRQLDALVAAGHPSLAGLSETAFRKLVQPLADRVEELPAAGGDRV